MLAGFWLLPPPPALRPLEPPEAAAALVLPPRNPVRDALDPPDDPPDTLVTPPCEPPSAARALPAFVVLASTGALLALLTSCSVPELVPDAVLVVDAAAGVDWVVAEPPAREA